MSSPQGGACDWACFDHVHPCYKCKGWQCKNRNEDMNSSKTKTKFQKELSENDSTHVNRQSHLLRVIKAWDCHFDDHFNVLDAP